MEYFFLTCRYGEPREDVKETNPGTVAKPTKTSCLFGKLIPWLRGARGADDLVMINSL